MRRALELLILVTAVAACQTAAEDAGPRHVDPDDRVSFVVPRGFHVTRDRGTWVLVGDGAFERSIIMVRSVARDGWSDDRSLAMLVPATAEALTSLPRAQVSGPSKAEHPILDAAGFDVTFEPTSHPGERYRRRHVVLVGADRVFHVLLTAPASHADRATASFDRVLDSVREEG